MLKGSKGNKLSYTRVRSTTTLENTAENEHNLAILLSDISCQEKLIHKHNKTSEIMFTPSLYVVTEF